MENKSFVKTFLSGVLTGITCIVLIFAILGVTGKVNLRAFARSNNTLSGKIERKASSIEYYIDQYYLDEISDEAMQDSVYKGIVAGLQDDYAAYYTKEEYSSMKEKSSGVYYGIGAYVTTNEKTGDITIVKPIKNSPADRAGIKAGDIIYAVDDEVMTDKDLTTVLTKIKGKVGTSVKITVERGSNKTHIDYDVVRENIEEDTVASKMLENNIGYIAVTGFEEVTANQFSSAVDKLEKKKAKSLIIDLRDNGGGLLSTAVTMLDRLLPKEKVVYTRDKNGQGEEYYATDDKKVDIPIVVLVNENSASASEVFSGALQDYGAAKLVGTKTFGKGIVQTIFDLQDGTALKMTTAKYYTPKGRNIHGKGLTPDIEVKNTSSKQTDSSVKLSVKQLIKQDNQLQKAIEVLEE